MAHGAFSPRPNSRRAVFHTLDGGAGSATIRRAMQLGIDPKNDYAFKCVFGDEHHTRVLIHVLNAVLRPPTECRVASVEILNPFSDRDVLDEKLSILDIKARDQSGRYFNVEMQMVPHPSDRRRFLYYWAKIYGSQLLSGDDYKLLEPAISICFVDGLLFPETEECHLHFRLWDPQVELALNDHLAIHAFQLPKFTKSGQDLTDPLDLWLYFLNNAKGWIRKICRNDCGFRRWRKLWRHCAD